MDKRRWVLVTLGAAVFALTLGGVTVATGGLLQVRDPENANGGSITAPPPLAPPIPVEQWALAQTPSAAPAKASDGRPVAQLRQLPFKLSRMSTSYPDQNREPPVGEVSYRMLAGIRYEGTDGHVIIITTMKPSPAAAQQTTILGNETVQLADGSKAYVSTDMPGEGPNKLVQVRGDVFIVLASDLPIDQLRTLMTEVVIP